MPPNSQLGQLIDDYKRTHSATDSGLAQRIGITRQSLNQWRTGDFAALPKAANLRALATEIGRPYRHVLSAALFDSGYLNAGEGTAARPYDEVLHDAIAALTEAHRLTNQPMRQTSSGKWEPDPDPRSALPIDWAEFVTLALAGAAANAGGIEPILAGRPGSWEAECVRQTLQSTVVDDTDLLRHRTEPVIVDLWVDSILNTLEDPTDDEYVNAHIALDQRAAAIPHPTDLPPGPFSPNDPRITAADWVDVDDNGYLKITYRNWTGGPEDTALMNELTAELQSAHEPTAGELAHQAALDSIADLIDALEQQQKREYADYANQLTIAITSRLADLPLSVPITVTISQAPQTWEEGEFDKHAPPRYPSNPIDDAIESAIAHTPTPAHLPGSPLDRLNA